MTMYMKLMTAYGNSAGIDFKFNGVVANTLPAHRVIQHFQEAKGADVANKLVMSLYRQYFEEEKHPSSKETLMAACKEAGIDEGYDSVFTLANFRPLAMSPSLPREENTANFDPKRRGKSH
jgi:predicted DsbA family dithiol-disulfide isomerase